MNDTNTISAEQRLLASLAHAAILAQGLGLVAGVVVYVTQRDKSRYVAFQGLQAAVFQAVSLLVAILSWVAWTIFYLLTLIPLISGAAGDEPGFWFWAGLGSMIIPLLIMLAFGLMGLVGAWRVWRGADFRYPVVGPWLERAGLFDAN